MDIRKVKKRGTVKTKLIVIPLVLVLLGLVGGEMIDREQDIGRIMENLATISEENAAGTQEASASVEEQAAGLEEVSNSSEELANIAEELNKKIKKFKI